MFLRYEELWTEASGNKLQLTWPKKSWKWKKKIKTKQRNKNVQWLHRWPESNFVETFVRLQWETSENTILTIQGNGYIATTVWCRGIKKKRIVQSQSLTFIWRSANTNSSTWSQFTHESFEDCKIRINKL